MNSTVAFIEVGSTNTKGFIYKESKIIDLPILNITFKKNYIENKKLIEEDKSKLFNFVNDIKKDVSKIYTFGTSVFRNLNDKQKKGFLNEFKSKTGFEFTICSLKEENEYTVYGSISNLKYKDNVAVLVIGGGSVEISICRNNKIIESVNTNFGVFDLYKDFGDIKENYATSNIDEITEYIKKNLNLPKEKADILILAGGNHLLYHEKAKYPLEKNTWFNDDFHPYKINTINKFKYDLKYFYEINLEDLKKLTSNNPNWWNETRGACAFTKCVSDVVGAKYIVPTKINMLYYILNKAYIDNNI